MMWLHLTTERSFSDWLNKTVPKLDSSISKNSDGSFRLSIKKNGIECTVAKFTKQGLPATFQEVNRQPGKSAMYLEIKWLNVDDEEFPHPVRLVQRVELAGGKSLTLMEIDVGEFRTKLKPSDPSLDIPPADLPMGIQVRDSR